MRTEKRPRAVVNVLVMMELAVGIDYALFIVSRVRSADAWHRPGGHARRPVAAALRRQGLARDDERGSHAQGALGAAGVRRRPRRAVVGGETATNVDLTDLSERYLPIVIAFVLGLSFLLLSLAFRSVVVPATSILMNLLSVGAAYGLLVLVFQKGVGADLLGFQQVDKIEAWLPLFLFSFLFGLSMDYQVFLLSRIRERYEQTRDNAASVMFGVGSTARIITGAALIMAAVFGGFATGQLVMFQELGFGLAVAVLVDATIVRSALVPATMRLLGDRNWFLPRHLAWLPRLGPDAPMPARAAARER